MITKRSSGLLTIAQNAGAHALAKTASLLTIEAISFALDLRLYSSGTSPRLSTHWKVLLVFLAGLVAESLVAAPTDLLRARKAMEVSTGLLSTVSAGARASPFGLLGGVLAMWKGWRLCFLLKLGIWIIDESFSFILTSVSVPLRVAY